MLTGLGSLSHVLTLSLSSPPATPDSLLTQHRLWSDEDVSDNGADGSGKGGGADYEIAFAESLEQQTSLAEHKGLFEEYSEIVIQFGHVTLFAAACPVAPVLALLNNLVEIRGDALTLAWSRRPFITSAVSTGIGVWIQLLEAISMMSILTNLGTTRPLALFFSAFCLKLTRLLLSIT